MLWAAAIQGFSASIFTVRSSLFAVPVYERFGFVASGPVGTKDGISFQPMESQRG
ncbi:MAG: GNAT family N-acetyltransferase [Natronospirillum sp.]